ncbi:MAG: ABC transporter substrate-binding protein, partial [Alphaproteobacteria bacterium]|nr:ABC transporter substrate-binding protein [Alphaproteobacteria bacterium]
GDGMHSTDLLSGAGFPAAEGWYCTIAAPHVLDKPEVAEWAKKFEAKFGGPPEDYSITAYDAGLVILDAIKRVAAAGKTVDRNTVRDAIQSAKLDTLQGEVSFDENGDITNRIVSVFQIKKDDKYPLNDTIHQYHYVGVAPAAA